MTERVRRQALERARALRLTLDVERVQRERRLEGLVADVLVLLGERGALVDALGHLEARVGQALKRLCAEGLGVREAARSCDLPAGELRRLLHCADTGGAGAATAAGAPATATAAPPGPTAAAADADADADADGPATAPCGSATATEDTACAPAPSAASEAGTVGAAGGAPGSAASTAAGTPAADAPVVEAGPDPVGQPPGTTPRCGPALPDPRPAGAGGASEGPRAAGPGRWSPSSQGPGRGGAPQEVPDRTLQPMPGAPQWPASSAGTPA